MNKYVYQLLIAFIVSFIGTVNAQDINPQLLKRHWNARWITCPDVPLKDYGVYNFRKKITLATAPDSFVIHVSADNRYRLFVNGQSVCFGPARGDIANWYFETIDIAPYLKAGDNIIAASVWNMGIHAPVAQISNQTAFVVQGDTEKEHIINTNNSWKVIQNKAYTACSTDNGARLRAYMVVGPGDKIDGSVYPWGWETLGYDDNSWLKPNTITAPSPYGVGTDNLWNLTPRNIPLMEESLQRMKTIRKAEGIKVTNAMLEGKSPLTIPANRTVSILIDQEHNTTAYPYILVSGGKDASVKISYTEALLDEKMRKGNRNEIEDRSVIGNYDIFLPDGKDKRMFSTLWLRTYRYVQLDITTKDEPLVIEDLYGFYTGYPFEQKATFAANDNSLKEIWDVGWRTARLCAGETYYDCPYYEQLQYPGDTRIQALISLHVAGDDRLMRKAILDFYNSMVPEGLTQGRYPSSRFQIIPPYALCWISMIYDYWMYRKDDEFVRQLLPAINNVLSWYEDKIDKDKGMLGPMRWWNFVDYTDGFSSGVPHGAVDGNSTVISMQLAYTLDQASKLYEYFDRVCEADKYKLMCDKINKATYDLCFDKVKNAMADTPEKKTYSQHASILAVLSGAIPESQHQSVMKTVVDDSSLIPVTFYFRFYLTQALKKAGLGDMYYPSLQYWRDMIKIGLTTFAEKPEPARSDCHAWSASPLYDYFAVICGITPSKPHFNAVTIEPSLGELKNVEASMPHPNGEIKVKLERVGKDGIKAEISLPDKVFGEFKWNGKTNSLRGGKQTVVVE